MASPYETTIELQNFAGINQTGDGWELSPRFAVEAENTDTTGGGLAPMRKGTVLSGNVPAPIGTLALMYRRFWAVESEREVLIAAAGGKLYYRLLSGGSWTQIWSGLSTDDFDYVNYEVNDGAITTDVLLITNALDGMLCVYGGTDIHVATVETPHKFGVITRHVERIWGSGIAGDPDHLVYSTPYDPMNWDANTEIPADGAGDIILPSWDGDSFGALRLFGEQLLAFKKNKIWRISGTSPEDYAVHEQYGGGAIEENTVVVHNSVVYMLSSTGLLKYENPTASPFMQPYVRNIMSRVNWAAVNKAYAAMWRGKYCLALPLDGSSINNCVLIYDTEEGTFNLMTGINVRAFLQVNEKLYYTTDTTPGTVWLMGAGDALPLLWRSGKMAASGVGSVKSDFNIYVAAHTDSEAGFDLTLKVITDRKAKEKVYHVVPGDRIKKLTVSNQGRWVQLEVRSTTTLPWALRGGLRVEMELDHD